MAGLTKEQRAAKAAAQVEQTTDATQDTSPVDGLVAMKSGSEELRVHPSCVKSHQDAGWVVA